MMGGKTVAGMMGQTGDMLSHPSVWNVYFDTTDLAKTLTTVTEAGGKIFMPAQPVMDLGIMAFCVDPTGGAFGLWQAGTHKGAQLFGDPGAMAWHELRTRDLKTALPFYEKVLGNALAKMDGPMEYYTQKADGKMHAGFMNMPAEMPKDVPSHWTTYFSVKNADAAASKIKATGGKVMVEPFDTPFGRNGYAMDPFGAPFAFIQPPA